MVSIAYMDPTNYVTDLAAGAGYRYDLLWVCWLAPIIGMLLQYLSGKLGIATGNSLPEQIKRSLGGKKRFVVPYWLAAELVAAITDLAEYLGTVLGLNLLFGVPLFYAAILGACDIVILLTLMNSRFRFIERYFVLLISILIIGIFFNLFIIRPDTVQIMYHLAVPTIPNSSALLVAVGMLGATVMPHALFVHSWLARNKATMMGSWARYQEPGAQPWLTVQEKMRLARFHRNETVVALSIAGLVNAGILLVAVPLYPNLSLTINSFVSGLSTVYGYAIGTILVLVLLASGLASSALGTIAGQTIMEGLIGKPTNPWKRRVVTRVINVIPAAIAVLIGLDPFRLLVIIPVILSMMLPLPVIPLIHYTSRTKFMGPLVNKNITIVLSVIVLLIILALNGFLLTTIL
jgi:manganese transport protein